MNQHKEYFYDDTKAYNRLVAEVGEWIGTPFSSNASVKRFGVCCHKLAHAVYRDSGFEVDQPPDAPMNHWKSSSESLVEPWIKTQAGRFHAVKTISHAGIKRGSLLGFTIGNCVHHVGVALENFNFIHVIEYHTVSIASLKDPTWADRLARQWIPLVT